MEAAKKRKLLGEEQKSEVFPMSGAETFVERAFGEILSEIENLTRLGINVYGGHSAAQKMHREANRVRQLIERVLKFYLKKVAFKSA